MLLNTFVTYSNMTQNTPINVPLIAVISFVGLLVFLMLRNR